MPDAWVTEQLFPGPGRAWSAPRGLRADTGLVPVLLDPADGGEAFHFIDAGWPIGALDGLDYQRLGEVRVLHSDIGHQGPSRCCRRKPSPDQGFFLTDLR